MLFSKQISHSHYSEQITDSVYTYVIHKSKMDEIKSDINHCLARLSYCCLYLNCTQYFPLETLQDIKRQRRMTKEHSSFLVNSNIFN